MQTLKEDIRTRILQAAQADFLACGFTEASTRRIIRKAKISNGNLYNYFKSKEDLFYAITDPFHDLFSDFLTNAFGDEGMEDFGAERIELITARTGELVHEHHQELVIIMDKSQGTKYETYKTGIIKTLSEHFQKNARAEFQQSGPGEGFIMQVVATNIIEGLLKISKSYKNKSWCVENVRFLFLYHMNGIVQFY